MSNEQQHLEALKDIRSMMERSSRFVSLNGVAGIFVGVFALLGAGAAYYYVATKGSSLAYFEYASDINGRLDPGFLKFFIGDALAVLLLSVLASSLLTMRKARKAGLTIWDHTARRLFVNMMIPLLAGGCFCLVMVFHGMIAFVAPSMLIFYGLALVNASKYTTLEEVRVLGLLQLMLGLFAALFIEYGLACWALGFGLLHIVYGTLMYFKHEK